MWICLVPPPIPTQSEVDSLKIAARAQGKVGTQVGIWRLLMAEEELVKSAE